MHRIEFTCGMDITEACQRLVSAADEHGEAGADFNEIELVARRGDDHRTIVAYYQAECQRRSDEWHASDEYKAQQAAEEEADRLRQAELQEAMRDAPERPTWRDETKYLEWRRKNEGDGYSLGCFTFAERWARLMEGRRSFGEPVEQCASRMCRLADSEGITGFMYGCAISILSQCWTYGDQLRAWHDSGGR